MVLNVVKLREVVFVFLLEVGKVEEVLGGGFNELFIVVGFGF